MSDYKGYRFLEKEGDISGENLYPRLRISTITVNSTSILTLSW